MKAPQVKTKITFKSKKQTTETTTKSTQVYFSGKTLELTVQTTQENDIIYYINEHFPIMNLHIRNQFSFKILLGKDFH